MWNTPGQGQVAPDSIQIGLGAGEILFLLSQNPKWVLWAGQSHILASFVYFSAAVRFV